MIPQNSSFTGLQTQGVLLAVRVAAVSLIAAMTCRIDFTFFIAFGFALALITLWNVKIGNLGRISYCFFAATTLWAGVAAALILTGHDGITIAFVLCMMLMDVSVFILSFGKKSQ